MKEKETDNLSWVNIILWVVIMGSGITMFILFAVTAGINMGDRAEQCENIAKLDYGGDKFSCTWNSYFDNCQCERLECKEYSCINMNETLIFEIKEE